MRLLKLKEGSKVRLSQIEAVTVIWSQPKGRRCDRSASTKAKARFVTHAVRWMRFLGWLDEPEREHHPHHAKVAIFGKWLRQERGLSTATIEDYCRATDRFFCRLAEKDVPLSALRMTDMDDVIAAEHKRGAWNRRTIHDYAQRLRPFFRFAEARGWCVRGMASGIMPPRFMRDEGLPKGLKRTDVQRLLATTEGDRPADKRDRAILMLFIVYGLRAGEVGGLRLDDLSWENEILRVRCPKSGRTHTYPLSRAVGDAILCYIREVRPSRFGRALFFTMRAPIRPLERRTLGKIVKDRLASLGIITGKRGTHALRHAAAQHLLDQGMSMKVIGDFLGHRDPSSTAVYAKVNLAALREVAALDLEGLV
ncbi:tyrosine-type recombinase/integrase [Bradyrhizobium sp. STM 3809]|uniref:tyrosine-type recombinase/integrase n=1 Tax=Bradyrhizobium sp. STM 3809 TaxID=551936 RepID=UPI001F0A3385|nr:tyrosine-type recombinase/integrase [Bradyrhizobium sp. STM 3809]